MDTKKKGGIDWYYSLFSSRGAIIELPVYTHTGVLEARMFEDSGTTEEPENLCAMIGLVIVKRKTFESVTSLDAWAKGWNL